MMTEIVLSDISISFLQGSKTEFSFRHLNSRFSKGLNIIVGPSGCGKTTILNMVSGLIKPDKGEVLFDGVPRDPSSASFFGRTLSYMTVERNEIPALSAYDNLRLVNDDKYEIERILSDMGLMDAKDRRVSKMSKGERARLAIARSLLQKAEVSLFDEPTANLDADSSKKAFAFIKQESRHNITLLVTHDLTAAMEYGDRVYQLENGALVLKKDSPVSSDCLPPRQKPLGKPANAPLIRLGIRKAFQKKAPSFVSGVLLFVSFLFGFVGMASFFPDADATFASGVEGLSGDGYLCSDTRLTREVSPSNFFQSQNSKDIYGFNVFSLACAGDSLPVGIYEETKPLIPLQRSPDANEEAMASYRDTETTHYYPIALTAQQKEAVSGLKGIDYQIGDVLPLSLSESSPSIFDKFVLSDVFSAVGETQDLDLSNSYPAFISQNTYEQLIFDAGIPDSDIEESLIQEVTDYNNYVDANKMDESLKYYGNPSFGGKFTKAALLSDYFYDDESSVPEKDGGFFLYGSLPKNENEIAIYNYQAFALLGPGHDSATESFFSSYPDGYPLKSLEEFPAGISDRKFKIVGTYGYVLPSDGGQRLTQQDCLIISDVLYDKIMSKIHSDYYLPGYPAQWNACYSKAYLAQNSALLQNKTIITRDSEISSFSNLLSNSQSMARFLSISGLFLFAVGILICLLYLMNVFSGLKSDFDVMRLWGVQGDRQRIVFLSSTMALLSPPFVLTLIFGYPFLCLIGSFEGASIRFPGMLLYHFGWSFLLIAGLFVLALLLAMIPFLLSRKTTTIWERIKNDQ